MPISDLHYYIRSRSYNYARAQLLRVPNEATSLNTPRQLPLHVAVYHLFHYDSHTHRWDGNLVELVYDLLEICPQAVRVRDIRGDTVLHIACKSFEHRSAFTRNEADLPEEVQIQLDVLSNIIDACPDAVSMKDTASDRSFPLQMPPLQILLQADHRVPLWLVKKLMRIYPQAITEGVMPSIFGNPLVEMCEFEETLPRARAIVELYPPAAIVQSLEGKVPLASQAWRFLSEKYRGTRTYETDIWSEFGLREHQLDAIVADEDQYGVFIEMILFLIKSAYHETTDDLPHGQVFRALHAACALNLPIDLIHLLTKKFPQQLMELDEQNGRLPLHIAAASRNKEDKRRVIKLLVQLNPGAVVALDSQGQLPLHLALANGDMWVDGVSSLVAPVALKTRDPTSQLYPVLMAAAAATQDSRLQGRELTDVREQAELQLRQQNPRFSSNYHLMLRIESEARHRAMHDGDLALETIFELVRAEPSFLRAGISE